MRLIIGFEIGVFNFFSKALFYTQIQRYIATPGTKCFMWAQKAAMSRIMEM